MKIKNTLNYDEYQSETMKNHRIASLRKKDHTNLTIAQVLILTCRCSSASASRTYCTASKQGYIEREGDICALR